MGDERQLLLESRCFLLALFARAFAEEPDKVFLEVLFGAHIDGELELVEDGRSAELMECLAAARSKAEGAADGSIANALGELREEYVRIFVGPGSLPARPWETMHRTGKNTLFQPGVLEVRNAYRRAGFLPQRYPHVSDDFIGLELDFMAKEAELAYRAFEEGRIEEMGRRLEQSLQFLQTHLLMWVGSFADSVQQHYGKCFYGAMAQMASVYLGRDREVLEALLADAL